MQIEKRITKAEIRERVRALAVNITGYYNKQATRRALENPEVEFVEPRPLVLVGVLKGAYMFLADLSRALQAVEHSIDFVSVESYHGTEAGSVRWRLDLQTDIRGKDVLVVEDIVDTGATIRAVLLSLHRMQPASLTAVVLLYKPKTTHAGVLLGVRFLGFAVAPGEFVVGYGLDYNGLYRNLPYIGTIQKRENTHARD